jgi:hypothetical protein
MKRVISVMMLVMVICSAKSQNVVYDANAEVRKVAAFTGIDVSGSVLLYISQGTETGVAVSADEEKYNSKIKTEVKNGILHISVDGGMWNGFSLTNKKLKAYVSVIQLQQLHVSGASNVVFTGKIQGDDLNMTVLGASEIKGALQLKNLIISISGASVVRLTGSADNANINASGAARINALDLQVETGKFDISQASHITISVSKELNANASGGSTIQYRGDAMAKSVNVNGGATIKKKS